VQGRIIEAKAGPTDRPQWMGFWIRISGSNDCPVAGPTNTITGCNFSLKRVVYDRMGGFDERFSNPAVFEDGDWGMRAYAAGFKIRYSPEPALHHLRVGTGGVDSGVTEQRLAENYYFCCFMYAYKHHHWLAVLRYTARLYIRGAKAAIRMIRRARARAKAGIAPGF